MSSSETTLRSLAEGSPLLSPILALLISLPTAIFTILLGVVLLYWLMVILGAAHIGEGAEGADGAADGLDIGHADVHVHMDGAHGDVDGADAHGGDADGDADGDGDGHAQSGGAAHGLLSSLKLRSVPATVVLSLLVFFSWTFSILGAQAAVAWLPAGGAQTAVHALLFLLAPMLALPATSVVIRPLAKVFAPHAAIARTDLVGKVCTVRTGTVTDRFGEGMLDDGGAGIVVRIRVDAGERVKRGDQVVIVDYDDAKQEFTVAPLEMDIERDGQRDGQSDAGTRQGLLK